MAKGIRLAGLWNRQAPNGEWYIEGSFGPSAIIRIYENKYKKTDKDPSHVMYVNDREKNAQTSTAKSQGSFNPRPPEVKSQGYVPAPTTKYAGSVPPEENNPPWPEGDEIDPIPF